MTLIPIDYTVEYKYNIFVFVFMCDWLDDILFVVRLDVLLLFLHLGVDGCSRYAV